jgi:hypothetical protein
VQRRTRVLFKSRSTDDLFKEGRGSRNPFNGGERLTLCQNLFGAWIVTKAWGSATKKGFRKSQDLVCSDYQSDLKTYSKLQQRREKRGYQKIN